MATDSPKGKGKEQKCNQGMMEAVNREIRRIRESSERAGEAEMGKSGRLRLRLRLRLGFRNGMSFGKPASQMMMNSQRRIPVEWSFCFFSVPVRPGCVFEDSHRCVHSGRRIQDLTGTSVISPRPGSQLPGNAGMGVPRLFRTVMRRRLPVFAGQKLKRSNAETLKLGKGAGRKRK